MRKLITVFIKNGERAIKNSFGALRIRNAHFDSSPVIIFTAGEKYGEKSLLS